MEELKDIEPVAKLGGKPLYSAEQMQEYAKNMVYKSLFENTPYGTGKEKFVQFLVDDFFEEEKQDEEVCRNSK